MTDVKISNSFSDNDDNGSPGLVGGSGDSNASHLQTGWAAGGGLEAALSRNWTVRAEYLFVDLGSVNTTNTVTNPTPIFSGRTDQITTSSKLTGQIARVGLNYRFP